jgi:hypothetical protein
MTSSLARVRARRAQIASRLEAIGRETTDLRAEDSDLAVTERTLARLEGDTQPKLDLVPVSTDPLADKFSGKKPSIKELIIRTLKQAPEIWVPGAAWVWDSIRREYGVEINKNSFYPQMHSMVNEDKTVARDGKKIALAERLSRRELREIAEREAAE